VPLSFEPNLGQVNQGQVNEGQTSDNVQWVARGPEYALFLSGHDAVLELNSIAPKKGMTDRPKIDSAAVRMNLLGAKTPKDAEGEEAQTGKANYFTGRDQSKWLSEVPMFGKVRLREVYPGIDLVYYGRQGQLEYDFVVAPGADPAKIALEFDGAKAALAADGDLVLPIAGGESWGGEKEIRFDKPTVYQMKDGVREPVAGGFRVGSDGKLSFALGVYDRSRELVIDPTLVFEGEIGTGNQQTIPTSMAVDSAGEMVITGYTNDLTFPVTTGAYQTTCSSPTDPFVVNGMTRCGASSAPSAFVTKLSADGTTLVYSTYLHGGGGYEQGQSVAVDAAGDTYVLGSTSSNDFPITNNAYQTYCQPTHQFQSTYYPNYGPTINSQCDNFSNGGGTEYTVNGPTLFIAELNPLGTALLYSTFFGGTQAAYPIGLALDSANNMYFMSNVIGLPADNLYVNNQNSNEVQFPVTDSAYQGVGISVNESAVSELSADGQTLLYSTFLGAIAGGSGHNVNGQAFALGPNGIAYLGGYTQASNFPTTAGAFKPTCTLYANDDSYCQTNMGFVAAIDTTQTGAASLKYASYLGGETTQGSNIPEQEVYGLAADANNDLFVTGYTYASNFPTTTGAFQTSCPVQSNTGSCPETAFLSKINPSGSELTWSTFVGGAVASPPYTYGNAITLDSQGDVYLYGFSQDIQGFPQLNPVQTDAGGNKVFVTTFTPDGKTLLFGTRFGSSSTTVASAAFPSANGIAVDATGNIYMTGYTNDGGTFGTTPGTYSTPATNGFNRTFFAKISPATTITPTITWAAPANIQYGTALSSTQLNAVATGTGGVTVAGTFVYTPTAGTVLGVGTQALNVAFTPTTAGYGPATATNSITVTQFTPVIAWAAPAAITTATPLSATQLDATATDVNGAAVPGTFVYTPATGTPLAAGTQTLSVTFTPTDTVDFASVAKTVQIVVTQPPAAATTTALTVTSGGSVATTVASGAVVTLTATVTAGGNSVSPGQVAFCDTAAATCTGTHLLATAQLVGGDSTSTATYKFVSGIGAHSYKAVFLGTARYAGSSSSAAALAVTGIYPTATTIAQIGTAGSYSLTATTVGTGSSTVAPTGTVSFLDTSNANAVLGTSALGAGTPGFALAQAAGSPVGVGTRPYGMATGDFNGDGLTDLVVQNYGSNNVSVLLGRGDGTFQPQVTYAVGTLPERVLVADMNGDGNLDLVVANTGSSTIGVLLGNGDGTFQPQVTYPCGSPVGLGVMDVNHDGIPDVVAGDYYSNTISVLLGNGDGTLKAAVTYAAGGTPQTVAEGDFNGDGNIDIVVGNESGATVGVLLGNGDGTFQTMVTYAVGNSPQSVQVGDFNADGKADLAVANNGDGTISVLLGNGDGTFQPQVTYPVGVQPVGLAIADFNGDGIEDITVGNTGQASLTQSVLLGKGDGTFAEQVTFPAGNFPYGTTTGDFNGDGLPDIVAANFNDGTATIFLSQPTETATAVLAGISPPGTGTHLVEASYPGDANYGNSLSAATPLIGLQLTPVISWILAVATIPYGTALGASQLNATAATPAGAPIQGTFTYTPASGTVLTPGTETLNVAFTPTDGVDYTTARGSTTLVVSGLALSAITPATATVGAGATTVTLTGSGFVPTAAARVNGTAIPTTYVSGTTLTAVIPASELTTLGTLNITVSDPSTGSLIGATSAARAFTVVGAPPAVTLTGPATTTPGSQPAVALTITNPYPLPLTAVFTLSFTAAGDALIDGQAVDDPATQFMSGGRSFTLTIPANTTVVPPVELQAGTDAGTITVSLALTANGANVTPAGLVPVTIMVPAIVPTLTSATVTRSGDLLTVVIHGFSNTREVSQASFVFTAEPGDTIATPDVNVPATTLFGGWFGSTESLTYGSTFTYTQIFNLSANAASIATVGVTLTNSVGTSAVTKSQ
jgi:hypothetical protein